MKKNYVIGSLSIMFMIFISTLASIGQIVPVKGGTATAINGTPVTILDPDIPRVKPCFTETYENSETSWSPFGWDTHISYYPSPSACPNHNPLTAGSPQGTISIVGNRMVFNNVAGAQECRTFKTLQAVYDNGFEASFDLNVSKSTGMGTAFLPFTMVSNMWYEPTFYAPTTAGNCDKFSPMDEIGIQCISDIGNGNLRLQMFLLDDGNNISPAATYMIPLNYDITYYIKLRVAKNGSATLSAYSDPARTVLIPNGSFCFKVPSSINGLSFLEHSTMSGGGYGRNSSGWVDNTSICQASSTCCTMDITGNNLICNAGSVKNTLFTISDASNSSAYTVTVTPSDVQFTQNGKNITITNWGAFTEAPKKVTIVAKANSCECDMLTGTKIIYVHPTLNTAFDVNNVGSTGGSMNNFSAVSTVNMPGVVNQWEFHTTPDMTGNNYNQQSTRDPEWAGANGNSVYNIYALSSNASHIYSNSYPNLTLGQFYLIKHVMVFADGLCGNPESKHVIFVGPNSKIISLGDPSAAGYKEKAADLLNKAKQ